MLVLAAAAALSSAIDRLNQRLMSRGVQLLVRNGDAAAMLLDVVSSTGATRVIAEREVESDWSLAVAAAAEGLKAQGARLSCWQVWAITAMVMLGLKSFIC